MWTEEPRLGGRRGGGCLGSFDQGLGHFQDQYVLEFLKVCDWKKGAAVLRSTSLSKKNIFFIRKKTNNKIGQVKNNNDLKGSTGTGNFILADNETIRLKL